MGLWLGVPHVIPLTEQISVSPPKKIASPPPGTTGFAVPAAWEKVGKIFLCTHWIFYWWVKFYPVCGRINAAWRMRRRFARPKVRPCALGVFPGVGFLDPRLYFEDGLGFPSLRVFVLGSAWKSHLLLRHSSAGTHGAFNSSGWSPEIPVLAGDEPRAVGNGAGRALSSWFDADLRGQAGPFPSNSRRQPSVKSPRLNPAM